MEYRKKEVADPSADKFIKKDWDALREKIKETGMRNSNTMAIAPTATIGYINGVEQSIEPNFSMLFVYENKSGNFYIMNEHFVRDMRAANIPAIHNALQTPRTYTLYHCEQYAFP